MGKSYTNNIVTSRNFRSKRRGGGGHAEHCNNITPYLYRYVQFYRDKAGGPTPELPIFFCFQDIVAVMPLADTFIIDFNRYYKRTLDYLISIFFAADVEQIQYNKTHKMHIPYGKV